MSKIWKRVLAVTMVVGLTACGSGEADNVTSKPAENAEENASSEAAAETTAAETVQTSNYEFPETAIVDNDQVSFIIKSIKNDGKDYEWTVYLENKTDLNLMYTIDEVSVNDFMSDPFWARSVSGGMKANEVISWYGLSNDGVKLPVTTTEFRLKIYDDDDWMADKLVDDVFTIAPMGEDKVMTYEREAQDGDVVLIDNETCTITAIGVDSEGFYGYEVDLYLVNKTDVPLMFSVDGVSVNGFMCDPFWASSVTAGKKEITSMSFSSSDFETNGIETVEVITLPFTVSNYETYDHLIEETVELHPNA